MRVRMICLGAVFVALTLGAAIPQFGQEPAGLRLSAIQFVTAWLLAYCGRSTRRKFATSQSAVRMPACRGSVLKRA
jgi:hypothetical protein